MGINDKKDDDSWYEGNRSNQFKFPHWLGVVYKDAKYAAICGMLFFSFVALSDYLSPKTNFGELNLLNEIYVLIFNALIGGAFGFMFGFPFIALFMLLPNKLFKSYKIKALIIAGFATPLFIILCYNFMVVGFAPALWTQMLGVSSIFKISAAIISGLISAYFIFLKQNLTDDSTLELDKKDIQENGK